MKSVRMSLLDGYASGRRDSLVSTLILSLLVSLFAPPLLFGADRFAPYWYIDDQTDATLEISSNSQEERVFSPVLLLKGETRLQLDPVVVPPGGTVRLPLRSALSKVLPSIDLHERSQEGRWGDGSRPDGVWGSAILSGDDFSAMHSWITTESAALHLSMMSKFMSENHSTSVLFSPWWRPTANAEVLFVLQNTTEQSLVINTSVHMNGEAVKGRSLRLSKKSAILVRLPDVLPGKADLATVGAVRFNVAKGLHGISGWTLLVDERIGFSAHLHPHDSHHQLGNKLQTSGVLLGHPAAIAGLPERIAFSPKILLVNTASKATTLSLAVHGEAPGQEESSGLDGVLPIEALSPRYKLPDVRLAPHEIRIVDVKKLIGNGREADKLKDGFIALELEHGGTAGAVLADALTVDEELRYYFYHPFVDTTAKRFFQTLTSFQLSGDKDAIVTINNPTDLASSYLLVIYYGSGGALHRYESLQRIGGKSLSTIDVRNLRDH